MTPAVLLTALTLLAPASVTGRKVDTREARDKARDCETLDDPAMAVAACRSALDLGLQPARTRSVRQLLARRLVGLMAWGELAQHYAEDVKAAPEDAGTRNRLGALLLFSLERIDEALPYLEEAVRLAPEVVSYRIDLGLGLAAAGRKAEALGALDEAVRLDEKALALRPAAAATREALRSGKAWP